MTARRDSGGTRGPGRPSDSTEFETWLNDIARLYAPLADSLGQMKFSKKLTSGAVVTCTFKEARESKRKQTPHDPSPPEGSTMSEESKTLGDALPQEMARVRDTVMPAYLSIGPAGTFALMGMRADLDRAAKAMAEGDVVKMLAAYESLKGWNT